MYRLGLIGGLLGFFGSALAYFFVGIREIFKLDGYLGIKSIIGLEVVILLSLLISLVGIISTFFESKIKGSILMILSGFLLLMLLKVFGVVSFALLFTNGFLVLWEESI